MKIENVSFAKSKGKGATPYDEMKSPIRAMEFLSRSWSPSTSDFLQIISSNSQLITNDEKNPQRPKETTIYSPKQEDIQMDLKQPKTWLNLHSLTTLFTSSRKEIKKSEKRLHTAQLHAALSLTQLAAAIAGLTSTTATAANTTTQEEGDPSHDMGNVLSSAAALVTNVCAEAAESLGAKRAQIRAAVDSGMAIQSPIDMIAVTATAATCLRGASLLKSRTLQVPLSRAQEMLKISAEISMIMPSGSKECKRVSIYLKHQLLMFCFRKKYLRGALTSSKEYQVMNISEEREEQQGNSLLCLKTKNGVIKLQFEDDMQSKIWITTILNLLEMQNPSHRY